MLTTQDYYLSRAKAERRAAADAACESSRSCHLRLAELHEEYADAALAPFSPAQSAASQPVAHYDPRLLQERALLALEEAGSPSLSGKLRLARADLAIALDDAKLLLGGR